MPSLGFEVIVRQMRLSEKLDLTRKQISGEVESSDLVKVLVSTVLLDDLKPLFTFEEWEIFGADHNDDFKLLLEKAFRLSGLGADAPKKAEEGPSTSSPEPLPDSWEEPSAS